MPWQAVATGCDYYEIVGAIVLLILLLIGLFVLFIVSVVLRRVAMVYWDVPLSEGIRKVGATRPACLRACLPASCSCSRFLHFCTLSRSCPRQFLLSIYLSLPHSSSLSFFLTRARERERTSDDGSTQLLVLSISSALSPPRASVSREF